MRMQLCMSAATDNLIFLRTAPVLKRMDKLLLPEKIESPEDTGLVNRLELRLQIGKGQGMARLQHGLQNQDTVGCGLYVMAFKQFYTISIHNCISFKSWGRPYCPQKYYILTNLPKIPECQSACPNMKPR